GSVRVGRIGNELILMPTHTQLEESDLDLIVSGTRDAVTMIEGFAREFSEENMLQAITFAHQHILTVIDMIEELRQKAGLGAKTLPEPAPVNPLLQVFRDRFYDEFRQRKQTEGKHARAAAIRELRERVFEQYLNADGKAGKEPEYAPEQVV